MPTREVSFNTKAYELALAEADGRHPSTDPLTLRDPGYEGLMIRVTGKSASWYCRFRRTFYRLGAVGDPKLKGDKRVGGAVYSAEAADEIASRIREMVKLGQDPASYITARALGHDHEQAAAAAGTIVAKAAGAWHFGKLVDEFIERKISADTITKTSVKPASWKTIKEAKQILLHEDLDDLRDKLARDVTRKDIEDIRDKWHREGFNSRQRKLITYIKSAYTWAKRKHSAAGLDDVLPWWIELAPEEYASQAAIKKSKGEAVTRPLTPAEVAKVLLLAEKHRVIPGRKLALPTDEITLSLLWFVMLTAQRTHAAAVVHASRVVDRLETDGWVEVSWLPVDVKSKRHHTIPISAEVYRRTIGRALAAPDRRESQWVFPSTREKDRGKDSKSDRPVGDTILNSLLRRLRGEDADEKGDGSGYDILAEAGLPDFTLHGVRKSLATFLADTDLPPGTASTILDHAMPAMSEEEAAVTARHYNQSQRLPLKHAGLTRWAGAVLGEYQSLLVKERTDRLGSLALTPTRIRRTIENLPAEDAWLFDRHLPELPGTKPAVTSTGTLDLRKLRVIGEDEGPDDLADVG